VWLRQECPQVGNSCRGAETQQEGGRQAVAQRLDVNSPCGVGHSHKGPCGRACVMCGRAVCVCKLQGVWGSVVGWGKGLQGWEVGVWGPVCVCVCKVGHSSEGV